MGKMTLPDQDQGNISDLPLEIQRHILSFLDGDSLRIASQITPLWKELSEDLWKPLCVIPSHFHETHVDNWQEFYFQLQGLDAAWEKGDPLFKLIDCKPGSELENWLARHNFSGIYDMVLYGSKLVLSVYNTIQILDLDGNVLNVLPSSLLDGEDGSALCFYADDEHVLCGTQNGKIKVFAMKDSSLCGVYQVGPEPISDIRIKDGLVYTIDICGTLHSWSLQGSSLTYIKELIFNNVPTVYRERNRERLIDTDGSTIVTSFDSTLILARIKEGDNHLKDVSEFSELNSILCFVVFGSKSFVAVGTRQGWVNLYCPCPKNNQYFNVGSFQTAFGDSITSIAAYGNHRLVFGDVNAEIHCMRVVEDSEGQVVFNQDSKVFTLESGHSYGSYVWAVKMDATRIYSGDSNSHLVIHDFWKSSVKALG